MDRRKKTLALVISSLFILSIFLTVTVIPPTSFIPTQPGTATYSPAIGAKADPNSENYPYWWNTSYTYRQEIVFNNTASILPVVNRPVDIFMSFASGRCHQGSIRVQYWNWNGTSGSWYPGDADPKSIPYQIWNATSTGNFYTSFTITFYVNVSANSLVSYFVYYDDIISTPPSFAPEISNSSPSAGVWYFEGQYYEARIDNSTNGGKIYISYNNVTGSSDPWAYDNEFNWSPEYVIDVIVKKGSKRWTDTWIYDSSGPSHPAINTSISEQQGPLFIIFSAVTNLTLTSGGIGDPAPPPNAGYVNVTYRFFKWGWTTETRTNITQSFTFGVWEQISGQRQRMLESGRYIGNSWRFDNHLGTLTYKYGTNATTVDPFTSQESIGEPYWFAVYNSTDGQAVGVVDLMIPTLNNNPNRNWNYLLSGTSYLPEKWERTLTANLTTSDYVNEKYALYVWNASGGNLSTFEDFADGISVIERESAPLIISIQNEEHIHYTVNVHVTDYDGNNLGSVNVTVYNGSNYVGSKITNSTSGNATFYLEPATYNFNATWTWNGVTWNGTAKSLTYKNSTTWEINSTQTNLELVFNNITTLRCRTQYGSPDYNPIQNAYVILYKNSSGQLVDSSHVDLSGWAEFHINRSSVFGNYDIKAFYEDNSSLGTPLLNENIDSNTSRNFTVSISPSQKYTYIIANETTTNPTWGTDVHLKIYWRDNSTNNLSTSDPNVGGSLNWTLNFINGTKVAGSTTLTPQGSAPDVYYLLNVSSSLLYGGVQYQVYINAKADNSTYLPATNQTVVSVKLATLNVTLTSLAGPYYWKHSDILLWANVTNNDTGQPITSATVTFSIIGTPVSGTMVSSPSGNYTYTIPASVVEASLNAVAYSLRLTVSITNYSTYQNTTQLVISPAKTQFIFPAGVLGYYGDVLSISVIYRDAVDYTPISSGSVSYYILYVNVSGTLYPSAEGNWTGNFNSTLVGPGLYTVRLTTYSPNYEVYTNYISIYIQRIPIEIKSDDIVSGTVNEDLLISVQLEDHNNEPILNATVLYSVKRSDGSLVDTGNLSDTSNNGTYSDLFTLAPTLIPPGNYRIEIFTYKENYTESQKVIQLAVQGAPTVLYASTAYFSSLNNPAVFFFGNFGQTENNMPFAVFTFRFADRNGSAIPNASVSAGGWPLISLGGGYYAVVVPTLGLPPSSYPIVVSASGALYEPQQSFFILQVKETSVLIPLGNVRVPLTIFLVIILSVAIPVSVFLTYSFVKRARIPAIVRRIDQLILAISRGEKVDVNVIPRESVLSRILAKEVGIVGVEPVVEVYVPVELVDRLAALLVESGMAEKEAQALAIELKKAAPAERERLLESVGIPSKTSARVIQLIEEEEEKAKTFIKPHVEPTEPEPEKEPEESPEKLKEEETKKETGESEEKTDEKEDGEETE